MTTSNIKWQSVKKLVSNFAFEISTALRALQLSPAAQTTMDENTLWARKLKLPLRLGESHFHSNVPYEGYQLYHRKKRSDVTIYTYDLFRQSDLSSLLWRVKEWVVAPSDNK